MSDPTAVKKRGVRHLRDVGRLVDSRVARLQDAITGGADAPWARAVLAGLRSAVRREPGSVSEVWEWTSVPVDEHAPDAPTREEWAVHAALCLYALHQQGRSDPMHRPGQGLGQAVRLLAGTDSDLDSPVRRRFAKVVTATSIDECLHHLRGLVTQFRSAQPPIGLDYAMLADDLVRLQQPGGASSVRLRWSRQYYHVVSTASDHESDRSKENQE